MAAQRLEPAAAHWLQIAGLAAVAPHVFELPAWVFAVYGVSVGWRFGIERLGWYRPGRVVRALLAILAIVAVHRQFGSLLGRDPGMSLLITLLALKLQETRSARDAYVSVFLYFIVILGSFLYGQTIERGVYGAIAALLAVMAMIRLAQPSGMDARATLLTASTLLLKAIPIALIVYFVFPRLQGALWGMPEEPQAALTGITDSMRPGSINQLTDSNEAAFRVRFEGDAPVARDRYWRVLVLWQTDGVSWSRGGPASGESFVSRAAPVRYSVTLEPTTNRWLPALDLPATTPPASRVLPGFILEHRRPVRERLNYELTSFTRYRTGGLSEDARRHALALPGAASARTRALAERFRLRGGGDARATAQAVLEHFRNEPFVYTLSPPLLGADPIDAFLFESRRGFCEHYAAAFVTLMREASVPSRVVLGYQGGERNEAGDYLVVRQSDAHAWAEIWSAEEGWVRVDPTAAVAPERVELGIDAVRRLEAQGLAAGRVPTADLRRLIELGWVEGAWHRTRQYWDALNMTWYSWVVDYTQERQRNLLERLGVGGWSWTALLTLAAALAGAILLLYSVLRRAPGERDRPAILYRRFCRKLARAGLLRAPHEGPVAFAERCATARTDLAAPVTRITDLYLSLRYAPPPPPVHAVAVLRHEVRALRVRR